MRRAARPLSAKPHCVRAGKRAELVPARCTWVTSEYLGDCDCVVQASRAELPRAPHMRRRHPHSTTLAVLCTMYVRTTLQIVPALCYTYVGARAACTHTGSCSFVTWCCFQPASVPSADATPVSVPPPGKVHKAHAEPLHGHHNQSQHQRKHLAMQPRVFGGASNQEGAPPRPASSNRGWCKCTRECAFASKGRTCHGCHVPPKNKPSTHFVAA